MSIDLEAGVRERLTASIRAYAEDHLEEPVGDLKAALLLDFFLRECGPFVYNRAIADARAYLLERVDDLESVCFEPEPSEGPAS